MPKPHGRHSGKHRFKSTGRKAKQLRRAVFQHDSKYEAAAERSEHARINTVIRNKRRLLGRIVKMTVPQLEQHRANMLRNPKIPPRLRKRIQDSSPETFREIWMKITRISMRKLREQLPEE